MVSKWRVEGDLSSDSDTKDEELEANKTDGEKGSYKNRLWARGRGRDDKMKPRTYKRERRPESHGPRQQ
ncbi:unnamed protein product [Rhizophagus irregularis]|uniref:Uncharacterized protein n=1 Tax=Rhizophagus irregularis TaxID=588596 RepID=A0A2I1H6G5_9GLOM|nr:hypothetical protein RhiirA4_473287 [Rhizophagus irregularis]CAB4442317.1 unnamed protein product [Rhizophagus irregularis]CAB4442359.1 unnamed protein product [Rhizophagus irregularis]